MAGGLLAALLLTGGALAFTDTSFNYSTAKTGYLTIHGMAMVPSSDLSPDGYDNSWDNGLSAGNGGCFNTGINLPDGATVTDLRVWYASGNDVFYVKLVRSDVRDGATVDIAEFRPDDLTGVRNTGRVAVKGPLARIKNSLYAYALGVCLASTDRFYHARLIYKYTNAGD